MIGIVVPGVPLMTGGPITSNMVVLDVFEPKNVNNIGLYLIEPIPEDCGCGLYFSIPPFETLQFIGCVANPRPRYNYDGKVSDIFYTGWSLNPNVNVFNNIKIVAKLDKLDELKGAYEEKIKTDINQEFAKRIAKNLFNYLDSFNQNQDPNRNLLVVPLNSLQSWYDRFVEKYKMDPNFIMKTD